jgi:ComF family protein
MQISKYINYVFDFLFPPKESELELRGITTSEIFERLRGSSQTEFPFIFSVFSYQDRLVKELVWQIKYKKNKHALRIAGYALYTRLINIEGNVTLVPVPISRSRRNERGYNQSELLIEEIIKYDTNHKFNFDFNLIKRKVDIEKQTFKNKYDRFINTKDIFEVIGTKTIREKIVIIDDVSTTGSTINEMRNVLLKSGYGDVVGYALAH